MKAQTQGFAATVEEDFEPLAVDVEDHRGLAGDPQSFDAAQAKIGLG